MGRVRRPLPTTEFTAQLEQLLAEPQEDLMWSPSDTGRPAVCGPNTFAAKDRLKALGCKWSAQRKCWVARDVAMLRAAESALTGNAAKLTEGARAPVLSWSFTGVPDGVLVAELEARGYKVVRASNSDLLNQALRDEGVDGRQLLDETTAIFDELDEEPL